MKTPKVPKPAPPTAEDLARQQQAEQAASDAAARAERDRLAAEERAEMERRALAGGLRGRRALLSSAGEVGFQGATTIGGV